MRVLCKNIALFFIEEKMKAICNSIASLYIVKKVKTMDNGIVLSQSIQFKNVIDNCFYFIFYNAALPSCQKNSQLVD